MPCFKLLQNVGLTWKIASFEVTEGEDINEVEVGVLGTTLGSILKVPGPVLSLWRPSFLIIVCRPNSPSPSNFSLKWPFSQSYSPARRLPLSPDDATLLYRALAGNAISGGPGASIYHFITSLFR